MPETALTPSEFATTLAQDHVLSFRIAIGQTLLECCRLWVKDLDFQRNQLVVREGKGDKDRATLLPTAAHAPLRTRLEAARAQHHCDLASGAGWVEPPTPSLTNCPRQAAPGLGGWVFPATRTYPHEEIGQTRRHHLHETVLQLAVKEAARASGIAKRANCHT